jgi:hypothetical protein
MSRTWIPTAVSLALCVPLVVAAKVFGWSGEAIGVPLLAIMLVTSAWYAELAGRAGSEPHRPTTKSSREKPVS